MADPTLTFTRAVVAYKASDGYSTEQTYRIDAQTPRPEAAWLDAFEELSRLLHLFGHGEEAMRIAQEAGDRVKAWRDSRP